MNDLIKCLFNDIKYIIFSFFLLLFQNYIFQFHFGILKRELLFQYILKLQNFLICVSNKLSDVMFIFYEANPKNKLNIN